MPSARITTASSIGPRLAFEMPFLQSQLKEAGAIRLLDAACGTGMHAIALAQAGFDVVGVDFSHRMIEHARANAQAAQVAVQFEQAGFGELENVFGAGQFDAVLCLGNSLPHVLSSQQLEKALADFAASLKPGGLVIIQNRNFDAVMAHRLRWMEPQAAREGEAEWLFLRFYDFEQDDLITFNIITLLREGGNAWTQSVHSTRLRPLLADEMRTSLNRADFRSISLYGDLKGMPFNSATSGNLIVCARRA